MNRYVMALDQGTTSSRCILFRQDGSIASAASREFPQLFPRDGWVEHDPMAIWSSQISAAYEALLRIGGSWQEVAAIGITNQRETTVVWDRQTGEPIHPAIVWQCRRTAEDCEQLRRAGYGKMIREKTGLLLDPYFSATKLRYILEHVEGARARAAAGELCFGTVDTWLMYRLSGGRIFATDYSNASRTMLFNINTLSWDDELLALFDVPRAILPEVKPSSCLFGYSDSNVLGAAIPICGVAGDQQAALFGQYCFDPGMVKNTYGTGGFLLMNTGSLPCYADNGLLTTVAWGIGERVTYAVEGSVFVAGAAIQWLRDGLKIIDAAQDSEYMASKVPDSGGVYVVPAFSGLGAPEWDPHARGLIIGIHRGTDKCHIIRATLESLAYQTADVVALMQDCAGMPVQRLWVDGGAASNNLLLSMQADILGIPVERPAGIEATALGAAYLAGLSAGLYRDLDHIRENKQIDRVFTPALSEEARAEKLAGWRQAVSRCLGWKK